MFAVDMMSSVDEATTMPDMNAEDIVLEWTYIADEERRACRSSKSGHPSFTVAC